MIVNQLRRVVYEPMPKMPLSAQIYFFIQYYYDMMTSFSFSFYFFLIYRFDRDWKKIEAFVGSKTVIQVNNTNYK